VTFAETHARHGDAAVLPFAAAGTLWYDVGEVPRVNVHWVKEASMSQIDLRAVKAAARDEFGTDPGIQGFGIGDGTLRIYVRDPAVRERLPKRYHGVDVEFVVTGDVTAQAGSGW
jgi:hypothetical protein